MSRVLSILERVSSILPVIQKPERRVSLRDKFIWTAIVLTIYLIMGQIPLYGTSAITEEYYAAFHRIIFASKHGTLLELGIGPIVTAGLIMQLLVGSKIINLDLSKPRDRAIFTSSQKLLTFIMILVEASAYVFSGTYGRLSLDLSLIVLFQLMMASILIVLMDELIQKGWGLGSGVSLFIAVGVAQQIIRYTIAPVSIGGSNGYVEYLGVIPNAISIVMSGGPITEAIIRPHGNIPGLLGFFTMITLLIIIVYLQGMRIEIPITHAKYGGIKAKIPLQFLYVSNIPVILASALFANIMLFSRFLQSTLNPDGTNWLINTLGVFNSTAEGVSFTPIGGIAYYVNPPRGLSYIIANPSEVIHAIIYVLVLCTVCVLFAIAWVETSGLSARDQAEQIIKSGLQIPGFRSSESIIREKLNEYIKPLTILSGFIVGAIAALADLLEVIGTGTGILLLVSILWQYYQILIRERIAETYPAISRLIGET